MIAFLSSAARTQYAEDIIRVLALPPGGIIQFRYEKRLVHGELTNKVSKSCAKELPCIVCFLDISREMIGPYIVPCRRGQIIDAEDCGPFIVFRFFVGNFCWLKDPKSEYLEITKTLAGFLPRWETHGETINLTGYWALEVDKIPNLEESNTFLGFASACDQLANFPPFGSTEYPDKDQQDGRLAPFFHIAIKELKDGGAVRESHTNLLSGVRPNNGVFELAPRQNYTATTYHYYPPSSRQRFPMDRFLEFSIEAVESSFSRVTARRIDSEYDIKDFHFKTPTEPHEVLGVLGFRLKRQSHKIGDGDCELYVPIKIKPSVRRIVVSILGIAAGVSLPQIISASQKADLNTFDVAMMLFFGIVAGIAVVFGLKKSV